MSTSRSVSHTSSSSAASATSSGTPQSNVTEIGNSGINLINPAFQVNIDLDGGGNYTWPACTPVTFNITSFNGNSSDPVLDPPFLVWSWSSSAPPQFHAGGSTTPFSYTAPWRNGTEAKFFVLDRQFFFGTSTTFTAVSGPNDNCSAPSLTPYLDFTLDPHSASQDCTNATVLVGGGGTPPYSLFATGNVGLAEIDLDSLPVTIDLDPAVLSANYGNVTASTPLGPITPYIWFIMVDELDVSSPVLNLASPGNCTLTIKANPSVSALVTPTSGSNSGGGGGDSNAGLIAGVTTAAVVTVVVGLLVGCIFYRRGRRRGIAKAGGILDFHDKSASPANGRAEPYPTYRPTDRIEPIVPSPSEGSSSLQSPPGVVPSLTMRENPIATEPSSVRYVQHEDLADVAPSASNGVVDLPPVYADHSGRPIAFTSSGEASTLPAPLPESTQNLAPPVPVRREPSPTPPERRPEPLQAKGFMPFD